MFAKLFLLGTVIAIAQADGSFSDPCDQRLPISEETGILGFCATGAWTPALDEYNVALLNNTQLKSRTLVKLAPGELVANPSGAWNLAIVWNSVKISEDGNKLVIDWFPDNGGPMTLEWSETYSMYIQPQYEGNYVEEKNPNKQFIHYIMAFEATADPKVYTNVGAVSDMDPDGITEWTVTSPVAPCVCKAAWEFEGGTYSGCSSNTSIPDKTWCYTTMQCIGATTDSNAGTFYIDCGPTDGPDEQNNVTSSSSSSSSTTTTAEPTTVATVAQTKTLTITMNLDGVDLSTLDAAGFAAIEQATKDMAAAQGIDMKDVSEIIYKQNGKVVKAPTATTKNRRASGDITMEFVFKAGAVVDVDVLVKKLATAIEKNELTFSVEIDGKKIEAKGFAAAAAVEVKPGIVKSGASTTDFATGLIAMLATVATLL